MYPADNSQRRKGSEKNYVTGPSVHQQVRDSELKDDPGYKHYTPIKRNIRKELQPATFDSLTPKQ